VDIQLLKADSQKTLNRIAAAVDNRCQHHDMRFYHPEITLHRPLDDVAAELRR
jgi:hypothetical protein